MSTWAKAVCGLALAVCLGGLARAEEPRPCRSEELKGVQPAPMPKVFDTLLDVRTSGVRTAMFLFDIDADGKPTVLCAVGAATYQPVAADAAKALEGFTYWAADSTAGKAPLKILFLTGPGGMKIPSVLPDPDSPPCDDPAVGASGGPPHEPPLKPIYKPKPVYPLSASNQILAGKVTLVAEVNEAGAVRLICRGVGENVAAFETAAGYYTAQFRFAAEPGRAPFYYSVTAHYETPD